MCVLVRSSNHALALLFGTPSTWPRCHTSGFSSCKSVCSARIDAKRERRATAPHGSATCLNIKPRTKRRARRQSLRQSQRATRTTTTTQPTALLSLCCPDCCCCPSRHRHCHCHLTRWKLLPPQHLMNRLTRPSSRYRQGSRPPAPLRGPTRSRRPMRRPWSRSSRAATCRSTTSGHLPPPQSNASSACAFATDERWL